MKSDKERIIRGHRLNSVLLTDSELLEVRAQQRTFEGAYWRTALSVFATGLVIIKVFTREFFAIGITFFVFGAALLAIAVLRRYSIGDLFDPTIPFRSSADYVLLATLVSVAAYIALIVQLLALP